MSSPITDSVSDVADGGVDHKSASVDAIISALLQEYDALKTISETISPALLPLVRHYSAAVNLSK